MELSFFIEKSKLLFETVKEHRRTFHKNPELSFQEFKTSTYIKNYLTKLSIENYSCTETGVVGLIGKGDKCVGLRADIDALPIFEENESEFKSLNNGVMHACGHDMHTAMLLGAAEILKSIEDQLGGCVKLIFQPAEELIPGGASLMIKEAVLENPAPSAIFGQHVNPSDEVGKIALAAGPVMASGDELYFTITGKGSHAAQPHLGNDAVLAASHLVVYLQTFITKFRNPLNPGVLSITAINGGSATNIFPDKVQLLGTLRTFDNNWREFIHNELQTKCKELVALYNCEFELKIKKGYPPLVNNQSTSEFAKNTAIELLGTDKVLDFEPKMWAEDFAYFAEKVPSTFWFLGIKPTDKQEIPPLHNAKFCPDEQALINGTAMLCAAAVNYLK